MTSLSNLYKYAKTGIASKDMTSFDKLLALQLAGDGFSVQSISGVPPISFQSDGTPITVLSLKGNGSQSGTPEFVGVRTGNLAYGRTANVNINENGLIVRLAGYDVAIARVENGVVYTANSFVLAFYTDEPAIGSVSYNNSRIVAIAGNPTTFTAPITGYVAFRIAPSEPAMLNYGNTALAYEPFGYKIPITCAGQITPIYIGEPLRKALDGSNAVDVLSSAGTITREVDAEGNALATPTTQAVDVPEIPTVKGQNVLTVDSDLQPSEMSITGHIKAI